MHATVLPFPETVKAAPSARFEPRAKRLTAVYLKSLKPKDRPYDVWDADCRGLLLRVGKGRMTWMIACRMPGPGGRNVFKRMSLYRHYPTTGLAEARALAEVHLKRAKEQRETPRQAQQKAEAAELEAKRQAEAEEAAKAAQKLSLGDLCDEYVAYLRNRGKVESADHAQSLFRVHVKSQPAIADKPAASITPEDAADLLRPAYSAGKKRAAGITRAYLSSAFRCAARARVSAQFPAGFKRFAVIGNPVAGTDPIPVAPVHRWLSAAELRSYMSRLDDTRLSDKALRLCLYAGGQRLVQTLRAKVSDYDEPMHTLLLFDPKGKRPAPREHLLPLAPMAAALVAQLAARARALGSRYLFASRGGQHLTRKALTGRMDAIREAMDCGEHFDLRAIRRTCETMLAKVGVSKDIRAQLLSHGLDGVQAKHYDRYDYIDEKRDALARWEDHLAKLMADVAAR